MKKLALDLETLDVESFDTEQAAEGEGTVRAYATEANGYSCYPNCSAGNFTDWGSCYGGCSDSGCGPGEVCYTE